MLVCAVLLPQTKSLKRCFFFSSVDGDAAPLLLLGALDGSRLSMWACAKSGAEHALSVPGGVVALGTIDRLSESSGDDTGEYPREAALPDAVPFVPAAVAVVVVMRGTADVRAAASSGAEDDVTLPASDDDCELSDSTVTSACVPLYHSVSACLLLMTSAADTGFTPAVTLLRLDDVCCAVREPRAQSGERLLGKHNGGAAAGKVWQTVRRGGACTDILRNDVGDAPLPYAVAGGGTPGSPCALILGGCLVAHSLFLWLTTPCLGFFCSFCRKCAPHPIRPQTRRHTRANHCPSTERFTRQYR